MKTPAISVRIPDELLERARNAVFAMPKKRFSNLVIAGLSFQVKRLEKLHNKGKPFPKRTGELTKGYPAGTATK